VSPWRRSEAAHRTHRTIDYSQCDYGVSRGISRKRLDRKAYWSDNLSSK